MTDSPTEVIAREFGYFLHQEAAALALHSTRQANDPKE
jgi:hypothetical protein